MKQDMKIIRRRCRTAKMLDRLLLFLLLAGIAVFILYPLVSLIGRSVFKNGMFTLEYYRLLPARFWSGSYGIPYRVSGNRWRKKWQVSLFGQDGSRFRPGMKVRLDMQEKRY